MLLDTFAWVEFFRGTEKGNKVKKILKEKQCFTSAISLAELSYWAEKEKLNSKKILSSVKELSAILSLDNYILEAAGKISYSKKKEAKNFGMIDAIILACCKAYNLKIVTGDKHFEKETGAVIL